MLLGAKMALSLGMMVFLFSRIPLAGVAHALRQADPRWLVAAAALLLFSNALGAHQWNRLLHAAGIRIPFWKVFSYYHVGLFFNNFLPANIGGDLARVLDASRYGSSRATAFSTVLMDRLVGTVTLASLALVTTLPLLFPSYDTPPAFRHFHFPLLYLALVGFFGFSITLLWAVLHPALLPAVERALARVGLGGFGPALDDLAARLRGFRDQRRLFRELFTVAALIQVARIGVHVLVAWALGLHVRVLYFFLFVPLLAVIVSLPISLNGIGVREGAGIALFHLVGVGAGSAFSLQFTTYLVAVTVSLLGGLVFVVRTPRRRAAARRQRRIS
ncbi:MAG: flippase-like domain-containing protein [Candidatus Eisenbacteria bacterium]|nr:flippase-like domain-containing protein [Candidatus Eisenbacteria bacterium]